MKINQPYLCLTPRKGTTLMELMIVVAILGIIVTAGPKLFKNIFKMWRITDSRTEVLQNSRVSLNLIESLLRQALNSSIVLSRENNAQPPYSKIQFSTPSGETFQFYQLGTDLWVNQSSPGTALSRILIKNIRYISFGYPIISEENLIGVALCFEKGTVGSESKSFYLSTQKIKMMNP